MSLVQWGVTSGTKALLKDGRKDGKVKAIAETLDKLITSFFPDDPKGIKLFFVAYMLDPISEYLIGANKDDYQKIKAGL